jgi:hypothetical protein
VKGNVEAISNSRACASLYTMGYKVKQEAGRVLKEGYSDLIRA